MTIDRKWYAPIAAGAYLTMAILASVLVTFTLGYVLFLRPIEHSQQLAKTALSVQEQQTKRRQNDIDVIGGVICKIEQRTLLTARDPNQSQANRKSAGEAAIYYAGVLAKLNTTTPCAKIGHA